MPEAELGFHKDQQMRRSVPASIPVPYGSYSGAGATPRLLQEFSQKVLSDLENFVLFSVPDGTPIETVISLKSGVSAIFFSTFEQMVLEVEGEAQFTHPGRLPEQAFREFKAFVAFVDDPEDGIYKEAVNPYLPKFYRFYRSKGEEIEESFHDQVEFNAASLPHFDNLARNVWMLHKLTLSFDKATVRVMRVVRNEPFNHEFMEVVGQDEEHCEGSTPSAEKFVEHLLLPGLWINGSVIKSRVYLKPSGCEQHLPAPAEGVGSVNRTRPRNMDGEEQSHTDAKAPCVQQTETAAAMAEDLEATHTPPSERPQLGNDETTAAGGPSPSSGPDPTATLQEPQEVLVDEDMTDLSSNASPAREPKKRSGTSLWALGRRIALKGRRT